MHKSELSAAGPRKGRRQAEVCSPTTTPSTREWPARRLALFEYRHLYSRLIASPPTLCNMRPFSALVSQPTSPRRERDMLTTSAWPGPLQLGGDAPTRNWGHPAGVLITSTSGMATKLPTGKTGFGSAEALVQTIAGASNHCAKDVGCQDFFCG